MTEAAINNPATLALTGCGAMGVTIGLRLLSLGHRLNVYNRSPGKTGQLAAAGARVCGSPQEAADGCAAVISVLTDAAAVREVLFGAQGVLSRPGPAPLVIELGTHCPLAIARLSAQAVERGARLVDAPMTGSVHAATHGTLGFLVGAEPDALEAARPLLLAMGKEIFHFGLPGAGNQAKLALNLLVGVMAHGLAEAIAMLEAQQLDVGNFLAALDGSALASPLYRRIGERHLQRDSKARFSLANLEKDMLLACERARALDRPHAGASAVLGALQEMDAGFKRRDYSALIAWAGGAT